MAAQSVFANMVRCATSTVGTGAATLGAAVSSFLTPTQAGMSGTVIVTYCFEDGTSAREIGQGSLNVSTGVLTRTTVYNSTNSNAAISLSGSATVYLTVAAQDVGIPAPAYMRGYINGFTLSAAGGVGTFGVASGVACSDDFTTMILQTSTYTKTTGSWAVGSGNGSLDTGSIAASTWYHAFAIERIDTGVVDYLISTSLASPSMPSGYTKKRYIGSLLTDGSSHFVAFLQILDDFVWVTPVASPQNTTTLSTTALLMSLQVPPGIQVTAHIRGDIVNSGVYNALVSSPDEASGASNSPVGNISAATNSAFQGIRTDLRTNTSQQVRAISTAASTSINLVCFGYSNPLLRAS